MLGELGKSSENSIEGLFSGDNISSPEIEVHPDIRGKVYVVGEDYESDNCDIYGEQELEHDIRKVMYDSGVETRNYPTDQVLDEVKGIGDSLDQGVRVNGGHIGEVLKQFEFDE